MGYYKEFKQSLHDKYDGPAKIAVGEYLGARGYFCTFPETKSNKKADITALKPQLVLSLLELWKAVSNFLGSKIFPETKSINDIRLLKPQEHEVQVSIHWKDDEFPYPEIHVYERKKHLLETKNPLWIWVLNTARTKAYVIDKKLLTKEKLKPVFSAYLTEERGKDTYENRYCIPKEEATLINLKEANK